MQAGELAILNCTDGDTRISFNSNDPDEVERARAVVEDMLRRGYCISVVVGDKMERAVDFDPSKDEYIVEKSTPKQHAKPESETPSKKRSIHRRSAKEHGAVSVGMTAGGGIGVRVFPVVLRDVRRGRA